ncbi:MAG TPA: 2OG-Fe(II) oxygenase [Candidatus Baltobacteraceae bacterium]|nr:2OG-Fe(II) oxygenase [Candidatus Baltobacteraceae bacterium]
MSVLSPARRVDFAAVERALLDDGYAHLRDLLDAGDCRAVRALFERDELFRSHIVMERHGYGKGDYKYFGYPLPEPIASLRTEFYARLAPIANRWNEKLGRKERFPEAQQQFLALCSEHGQRRPTALVLRYRPGDYNCMHEDAYGEIAFPFQMTVFLSSLDEYTGGEFVLVEQRPRRQSRPIVVRPDLGDALIIPNHYRPVQGANGYYRTAFKHGVSEVRSGERYTLGIIFHDAR